MKSKHLVGILCLMMIMGSLSSCIKDNPSGSSSSSLSSSISSTISSSDSITSSISSSSNSTNVSSDITSSEDSSAQELVDQAYALLQYPNFTRGVNSNQNLETNIDGVKISYSIEDETSKKFINISSDNKTLEVNAPTKGDKIGSITVGDDWLAVCKIAATLKYNGITKTKFFGVKVIGKNKVLNYEEFMATTDGQQVLVHVTIDNIIPAMKYGNSLVWAHDDQGNSYYLYSVGAKYIGDEKIAVGNKVEVYAKKSIYNGLHQIKNVSNVALISKGGTVKAQQDISADLTSKTIDSKDLVKYVGAPVKATNIVLNELPEVGYPNQGVYDKIHLNCVIKGTEKTITLVVARGGSDAKAINDLVKTLQVNDVLTVEGWGEWHNGFQITLVPDSVITKTGTL